MQRYEKYAHSNPSIVEREEILQSYKTWRHLSAQELEFRKPQELYEWVRSHDEVGTHLEKSFENVDEDEIEQARKRAITYWMWPAIKKVYGVEFQTFGDYNRWLLAKRNKLGIAPRLEEAKDDTPSWSLK